LWFREKKVPGYKFPPKTKRFKVTPKPRAVKKRVEK
jgi:hypothetical protein